MNHPIAGVGYARGFDENGNVILHSTTLTDSGFNASTSLEEIRGGEGHSLQSMYAHTSKFDVTLKDCLVDLNYIAMQVGGDIVKGGDAFTSEEITIETANKITVSGTPKQFGGYGIVGWYHVEGESTEHTIKFNGKTATASGLPIGTVVCVTYVTTSDTARAFEVASTFMPKVIHLVFTLPLLNSGDVSTASQVGEWIVDVPKFMFNGTIDLSTTSAGTASGDISGTALATGASGCSGKSMYAKITEIIYSDTNPLSTATAIVAQDLELAKSDVATIKVIGLYGDGTANTEIPNSYFTFTKGTGTSATVDNNGVVTASTTSGETVIEVVPKDTKYNKMSAKVVVDVE